VNRRVTQCKFAVKLFLKDYSIKQSFKNNFTANLHCVKRLFTCRVELKNANRRLCQVTVDLRSLIWFGFCWPLCVRVHELYFLAYLCTMLMGVPLSILHVMFFGGATARRKARRCRFISCTAVITDAGRSVTKGKAWPPITGFRPHAWQPKPLSAITLHWWDYVPPSSHYYSTHCARSAAEKGYVLLMFYFFRYFYWFLSDQISQRLSDQSSRNLQDW